MRHPAYPTRTDLRAEAMAERMIALQNQSVETFRAARDAFAAVVAGLDFPLGSPIVGYDWEDVPAYLNDWARTVSPDETLAMEIAREEVQ